MVSWKPLQLSRFRGIPSKQLKLNSVSPPPAGCWTLELTFAVRFWQSCLCNHQQNQITQIPSAGMCAVRTTTNVTKQHQASQPLLKIMGMLGFRLFLQPPETQGINWHRCCNTAAQQISNLWSALSIFFSDWLECESSSSYISPAFSKMWQSVKLGRRSGAWLHSLNRNKPSVCQQLTNSLVFTHWYVSPFNKSLLSCTQGVLQVVDQVWRWIIEPPKNISQSYFRIYSCRRPSNLSLPEVGG